MIQLTDINGRTHVIHPDAIARLVEPGTSGKWHGINSEIMRMLEAQAANPAAISELIDRLEAAEKERDWHAERCEDAMNECDALRAEIEELHVLISAVKKQADAELRIRVKKEEEYARLCAKIEAMEQQEPVDVGSDVFRSAFEAALKAGNWPATRQGDDYRSPSTQIAWRIAFSTVNRLKLYLAPGAQGEEE